MFVLRHGQSFFNLLYTRDRVDPGIEDPELTPLGRQQAMAAAGQLAGIPLTRIIVSPYTRALQTAEPILAMTELTPVVMQVVRERAAFTCDVGSSPAALAARFPQHDFSHLPAVWWHRGIETAEATIARADEFRRIMAARDDDATTLLVSHWAFILALTGESLTNGEVLEYDPTSAPPATIEWC